MWNNGRNRGRVHAIFTRSLDMDILKGVGSNSCVKIVEKRYTHALLYLKKLCSGGKFRFKSTIV